MTTLGAKLKAAREQKNMTASELAEAIHAKIQVVQDIESDNFRRFSAAIYAKGFIKLYAEYLGMDPAPLIAEYVQKNAGEKPAKIEIPLKPPRPAGHVVQPEPVEAEPSPEPELPAPEPPPARRRIQIRPLDERRDGRSYGWFIRRMAARMVAPVRRFRLPQIPKPRHVREKFRSLGMPVAPQTVKYIGLALGAVLAVALLAVGVTQLVRMLSQPAIPVQVYEAREPLKLTHEPPAPYLSMKPGK